MASMIAPTVNALVRSGVSVQLVFGRDDNEIELKNSAGETLWKQCSRAGLDEREIIRIVGEKVLNVSEVSVPPK